MKRWIVKFLVNHGRDRLACRISSSLAYYYIGARVVRGLQNGLEIMRGGRDFKVYVDVDLCPTCTKKLKEFLHIQEDENET